jgi:hypothetical protein
MLFGHHITKAQLTKMAARASRRVVAGAEAALVVLWNKIRERTAQRWVDG